MNLDVKRLNNLKEEKKILERSMNLYYFDKKKRAILFEKIEKIEKEIERVEKYANNNIRKSSN